MVQTSSSWHGSRVLDDLKHFYERSIPVQNSADASIQCTEVCSLKIWPFTTCVLWLYSALSMCVWGRKIKQKHIPLCLMPHCEPWLSMLISHSVGAEWGSYTAWSDTLYNKRWMLISEIGREKNTTTPLLKKTVYSSLGNTTPPVEPYRLLA